MPLESFIAHDYRIATPWSLSLDQLGHTSLEPSTFRHRSHYFHEDEYVHLRLLAHISMPFVEGSHIFGGFPLGFLPWDDNMCHMVISLHILHGMT